MTRLLAGVMAVLSGIAATFSVLAAQTYEWFFAGAFALAAIAALAHAVVFAKSHRL